jgi:hypothetical protein
LTIASIDFELGGDARGQFDVAFVDGHLLLGEFSGSIGSGGNE